MDINNDQKLSREELINGNFKILKKDIKIFYFIQILKKKLIDFFRL